MGKITRDDPAHVFQFTIHLQLNEGHTAGHYPDTNYSNDQKTIALDSNFGSIYDGSLTDK